jgi:hypothetical protein
MVTKIFKDGVDFPKRATFEEMINADRVVVLNQDNKTFSIIKNRTGIQLYDVPITLLSVTLLN